MDELRKDCRHRSALKSRCNASFLSRYLSDRATRCCDGMQDAENIGLATVNPQPRNECLQNVYKMYRGRPNLWTYPVWKEAGRLYAYVQLRPCLRNVRFTHAIDNTKLWQVQSTAPSLGYPSIARFVTVQYQLPFGTRRGTGKVQRIIASCAANGRSRSASLKTRKLFYLQSFSTAQSL